MNEVYIGFLFPENLIILRTNFLDVTFFKQKTSTQRSCKKNPRHSFLSIIKLNYENQAIIITFLKPQFTNTVTLC